MYLKLCIVSEFAPILCISQKLHHYILACKVQIVHGNISTCAVAKCRQVLNQDVKLPILVICNGE